MTTIDEALGEFSEDAVTAKLLRGIYGVIPYSPKFPHYNGVSDAVIALDPGASAGTIDRAIGLAGDSEQLSDLIWMSQLLDKGDAGYAIATGLFSAYKLWQGKGLEALENDNQQRNDAVLKGLGMAYMAHRAYSGSVGEKVAGFRASSGGQALAMYYAAVEVALPFADNAALASGTLVSDLYTNHGAKQFSRLATMASGHDLGGAKEMLVGITEPVGKVVNLAKGYIDPVAAAAKPFLPTAVSGGDKLAGLVASGADMLPVYRLLGARLAAESAARAAVTG